MTLSNTVLLPHTVMPLYIFETRYRRMLSDTLSSDRVFIVANGANSGTGVGMNEPACEFATVGLIRMSALNADGTSTLILHGAARVRLKSLVRERPYRVARISLEPGDYDHSDPEIPVFRERLLALIDKLNAVSHSETVDALTACRSISDTEELTHFAMQSYCHIPELNQLILETTDFRKRIHIALHFFERQIAANELRNTSAQGFGDAGPFMN